VNEKNPLWLPKRSVRALIAVGLVGATIYLAVSGDGAIPQALTTLTGVVVTYYFKMREGE